MVLFSFKHTSKYKYTQAFILLTFSCRLCIQREQHSFCGWRLKEPIKLHHTLAKIGIGLVYVMVDFIDIGLVKLQGTWNKRYLQNEKLLPIVGIESRTFRLEDLRCTHCTICLIMFYSVRYVYVLYIDRYRWSRGRSIRGCFVVIALC